jgi:hypothetical protein
MLNNESKKPYEIGSSEVKQSCSCAHLEGIVGNAGTATCICNLGTRWE